MLLSLKVHVIIMIQFNFQASYPEVKSKEKRFLNSGGEKIVLHWKVQAVKG